MENSTSQTLIEHWNGHAWQIVPSPNDTTQALDDSLSGVAAVPHDEDVWAVGSVVAARNLIEAWNGSAWNIVPNP